MDIYPTPLVQEAFTMGSNYALTNAALALLPPGQVMAEGMYVIAIFRVDQPCCSFHHPHNTDFPKDGKSHWFQRAPFQVVGT